MSNSPLLALPYLSASQAQKHLTLNEALSLLDGLSHLAVATRNLAGPPSSPTDGDRYLIAASPTGEWSGHAGEVALRMEGAWRFMSPRSGWRLWVADELALLVFDGVTWVQPPTPSTLQNLSLLGVNATADATNKLAVSSSSVLFNNAGAGVQFKINKAAGTDTSSLLFQTGFSGRAEIGNTGDDDLHFKVSGDGSSYNESLIISAASGLVTVKNNLKLDPQSADPTTPSDGQVWYNSTTGKFRGRQNGASLDVIGAGGGLSDGDKGDITVSGSGATWTIDNDSVTNAKLAQMPAHTLKANITAGAATAVDSSLSAILDAELGSTQGLFVVRKGTGWGVIGPGTTNQVPTSQGAGADPIMATPAGGGSGSGDVVGPASATDNALARFDATTGKLVQNSTVTVSDAGQINAIAGTTTDAPFKFTSGTLNTTAQAGALEYDGIPHFSFDASARGVVPAIQFMTLTANNAGAVQTAAQKIFNTPTNGAFNVKANTTYKFKVWFALNTMSATSGSFGFALGGTATLTSQAWIATSSKQVALATPLAPFRVLASAALISLTTNNTSTTGVATIEGIVRVNSAGTLIPMFSLTVASNASVLAGSYAELIPIGITNTVTSEGNVN